MIVQFFLGGDGILWFGVSVCIEVVGGKGRVKLIEVLEGEIVGGLLQLVLDFGLSLVMSLFELDQFLGVWKFGAFLLHGEGVAVLGVLVLEKG